MINLLNRLLLGGIAMFAFLFFVVQDVWQAEAHPSVPLIFINEVVRDETITISGSHFPPNMEFTVRMGGYGSYGINGPLSPTVVNSGNGTFTAQIVIPDGVKGLSRIAVRLDHGIYSSFNWFYNNPVSVAVTPEGTRGAGGGSNAVPDQVYTGVPRLIFEKVEGEQVTVRSENFPPNQLFYITMGSVSSYGTGPSAGTFFSGDGADATHLLTIPGSIAHYGYIVVRFQTGHPYPTFYYATDNFDNPSGPMPPKNEPDTKPEVVPAPAPAVLWLGPPTITVCEVQANQTVTIVARNLPTNLTYNVQMGAYGSFGHGTPVGTLSPGSNSIVRQTFAIPAGLQGHQRIAIRADAGIYHAYNWFWNSTAAVC